MRGFVPTQQSTVDQMVDMLFKNNRPKATDRVLDPGCGPGAFIEGILRWCKRHHVEVPQIVGIELDKQRADIARQKFLAVPQVEIVTGDFLLDEFEGLFDFIIGNPPYVSILALKEEEKRRFRSRFKCAVGRFDLYMLFFERAVSLGRKGATLVFITPEKYTYVQAGSEVRKLLASHDVTDITLLEEDVFPGRTTYPTISRLRISNVGEHTQIQTRNGASFPVLLPKSGGSWRHLFSNDKPPEVAGSLCLESICRRISCGIATGADGVFVKNAEDLPEYLEQHAWPTISGRQLQPTSSKVKTSSVMLIPYSAESRLKCLEEIGELGDYLKRPEIQSKLAMRSCTQRKPWHAFHDAPQMAELLRPKILCKDISDNPVFWIDKDGLVVPRHSVYYIVPTHPGQIYRIAEYLNSDPVKAWISANAQRAANGFLRIQSSVLKRLPIPAELAQILPTENDRNLSSLQVKQLMSVEVLKVA